MPGIHESAEPFGPSVGGRMRPGGPAKRGQNRTVAVALTEYPGATDAARAEPAPGGGL